MGYGQRTLFICLTLERRLSGLKGDVLFLERTHAQFPEPTQCLDLPLTPVLEDPRPSCRVPGTHIVHLPTSRQTTIHHQIKLTNWKKRRKWPYITLTIREKRGGLGESPALLVSIIIYVMD